MSTSIPVNNPDDRVRFLEALGPGPLSLSAADDRNRSGTWAVVGHTVQPSTRSAALGHALNALPLGHVLHVRPYIPREGRPRPLGDALGQCCVDLDAAHPDRLRALGVEPAAVVETSPGRWQAWLRFPEPLPKAEVQRLLEGLSQALGLEAGSRQALHAGRVPGFPNGKYPERPMVRLVEATGRTADPAVLTRLMAPVPTPAIPPRRVIRTPMTGPQPTWPAKTLDDYRGVPQYHNDPNREDLAWAHYALDKMGWDPETVARTIDTDRAEHPRGQEKKGPHYGRTTVRAALAHQGPSLSR